jgi:hypothetical protein
VDLPQSIVPVKKTNSAIIFCTPSRNISLYREVYLRVQRVPIPHKYTERVINSPFVSRVSFKAFPVKSVGILLTALVLTGCGNDSTVAPTASSSASNSSSPSESPTADFIQDYSFYFVSETAQGFRLIREVQQVSKVENDLGDDKGFNSLVMLVNGQLPPFDGDHRTLWNNGTKVNNVTNTNGAATVDLTLGRISLGSESELRAIDQIVWTLMDNDPAITSVQ